MEIDNYDRYHILMFGLFFFNSSVLCEVTFVVGANVYSCFLLYPSEHSVCHQEFIIHVLDWFEPITIADILE